MAGGEILINEGRHIRRWVGDLLWVIDIHKTNSGLR